MKKIAKLLVLVFSLTVALSAELIGPGTMVSNTTGGIYEAHDVSHCVSIEFRAIVLNDALFKGNYLSLNYRNECAATSLYSVGFWPGDAIKVTGDKVEVNIPDVLAVSNGYAKGVGFAGPVPLVASWQKTNEWREDHSEVVTTHRQMPNGGVTNSKDNRDYSHFSNNFSASFAGISLPIGSECMAEGGPLQVYTKGATKISWRF